jgi:membrane protease YdiL (CAAX protease family)
MQGIAPRARSWTWAGLSIALFGLPLIVFVYRLAASDPGAGGAVALREALILALVAALLWIVRSREGLPLSSIGIGPGGLWRSLAWGLACFVLVAAGLAACLGVFAMLGVHYGQGGAPLSASLWGALLTVTRAGVAEEVFYRGYAIERLEALTGSRWIAALIPLICFAAFHIGRDGLEC